MKIAVISTHRVFNHGRLIGFDRYKFEGIITKFIHTPCMYNIRSNQFDKYIISENYINKNSGDIIYYFKAIGIDEYNNFN